MRRVSRATALATSLVGLLVAGTALAGCADESGGGAGTDSGTPPAGDIPFALVLPDDLAVSEDGSEVLADCWDGICRWDTSDGSLDRVDGGSHLAISPDWSLIAGVAEGATVVLVDAGSGDVVHELAEHRDEEVVDGSPIHEVAFSPDGELVASAGPDDAVIVWSVEDGTEVTRVGTDGKAAALAFSPDGRWLAASADRIELFDVPSGDHLAALPESTPGAAGLAWSPDGRWLAGPGPDAAAAVWDTEEFALADQLTGSSLQDLAFAPDSRTLAVTDTDDDVVRLWRPKAMGGDGAEIHELVGHTEEPGAVVFAPDGATVYSVARTQGVLAWDVRSATLAEEFELPER